MSPAEKGTSGGRLFESIDNLFDMVYYYFLCALAPTIIAMGAFEGLHAHYHAVPAFGFWDLFTTFVALKFLAEFLCRRADR